MKARATTRVVTVFLSLEPHYFLLYAESIALKSDSNVSGSDYSYKLMKNDVQPD